MQSYYQLKISDRRQGYVNYPGGKPVHLEEMTAGR